MEPWTILRIEELTAFGIALGAYLSLNGSIWLLLGLALAADLLMLGYLWGSHVGSRTYNLVHTYTLPLVVGTLGVWRNIRLAILVVSAWIGHIGIDRLLGYGLK